MTTTPARLPGLDGVRGTAVLLVILFHYTWVSFGWVGLQLFFVLSGFLITRNLLADHDLPIGHYLTRFYWRRSLRIFPLYFAYLGVLAVLWFTTGAPPTFGSEWPYLATYTLNLRRMYAAFLDNPFFGHLWSLSVEEQFYLVWPLLLFFVPTKRLVLFFAAVTLSGPLIRFGTVHVLASAGMASEALARATISFTPSQLDAFALGALLLYWPERLRRHTGVLFWAVTALVVAVRTTLLGVEHRPLLDTSIGFALASPRYGQLLWGYVLVNAWAASLMLHALYSEGVVARLMRSAPLEELGRISYGVYVLHQIVRYYGRQLVGPVHGLANAAFFVAYMVALVAIATASFRWFEQPLLRFRSLADRPVTRAEV